MPVYFFLTDDGERVDVDDTGVEMENEKAAIDAAQLKLVEIARLKLPDGIFARFTVDVTDAANSHFYGASLTFEGRTAEHHRESQEVHARQAEAAAEKIADLLRKP